MEQLKNLKKTILILLLFGLSIALLYFGKPFLFPLTLAGMLAMLLVPICEYFEKKKMPRALAALIGVLALMAAIGGIMTLLGWKVSGFAEDMSEMRQRGLEAFNKLREWINANLGIDKQKQEEIVENSQQEGGGAGNMLMTFTSGAFSIMVDTVLVLVYTFLFIIYRSKIKNFILMLVKEDKRPKTSLILQESAKVSQQYLGGLFKMIIVLWIMYGIGFSAIGVENAIFFAILCGILEIVPFVGNFLGSLITVLAVTIQGGDARMILGVVGIYIFIQFIQTYILEPLVVGNEVRINPLFTIIVLVLGELIWGIAGMILAIPLLGILIIIFDHIPSLKPYAYLISSEKKKRNKRK